MRKWKKTLEFFGKIEYYIIYKECNKIYALFIGGKMAVVKDLESLKALIQRVRKAQEEFATFDQQSDFL